MNTSRAMILHYAFCLRYECQSGDVAVGMGRSYDLETIFSTWKVLSAPALGVWGEGAVGKLAS